MNRDTDSFFEDTVCLRGRLEGFYDFDDYERVVTAAKANDRNACLVVPLGGEEGLRCGEIMALEWATPT